MGIVSLPRLIWATGLIWLLSACGQQDPAFTEETKSKDFDNADALATDRAHGGADSGAPGETDASGIGVGADGGSDGGGAVGAGGAGSGAVDGGGLAGATGGGGGGVDGAGGTAGGTDGMAGGTAGGSTAGGGTAGGSTAGGSTAGGTGGSTTGGTAGGEGGIGVTRRTVELTQKGPGKVDILWVVDTSNSMSEEQAGLATNFNAMIQELNATGHDFQTAITTTDVCQNQIPSDLSQRVCPADYGGSSATHLRGSFVGTTGRKVLKHGDSDLISRFNTYTNQGTDGSGFEHGLYAAKLAVQKSLAGQNEALVRPDAFLAVIVVSDEEDDGIGLGMMDAAAGHNFVAEGLTTFRFTDDDMINYLLGVKGSGKFSISGIVATRDAGGHLCSSSASQPTEEGTQYIKAAQKSGGIVQSICDTDWSDKLAQIGVDLDAQITQVSLPSKADPATITVEVDGHLMTEWTYAAGSNAVKFNTGHVPAEGASIKVSYIEMH